MASSDSCIVTLGFHRDQILALKNEWAALSGSAQHRRGLQVLSSLSERKTEFYFSDEYFNYPDYPVKILPYPDTLPIPTTADAIHDILTIKAGDQMNCARLHDGLLTERASTSGADMVNSIFDYLTAKTADNLRKVILPISAPISRAQCEMTNAGLGKLDVNILVPPFFRSEGRVFLPDFKEGWTARFLIPPAFNTMAPQNYICGQVRAHLFGRKICLFCPPDEGHLDLWYSQKWDNYGVQKMVKFIQTAEKLFVWVSSRPCVMVLPPHCFHSVFTLTAACDIGVRVGSDFWGDEMKAVVKIMKRESQKTEVRASDEYLVGWTRDVMRDLRLWVQWVEDIKREPSVKENELMRTLEPWMDVFKAAIRQGAGGD